MKTRTFVAWSLLIVLGMADAPDTFAQQRPPVRPNPPRGQPAQVPDSLKPQLDVEYAKVGDLSLKLDVYVPKDVKAEDKLPLIVWVHGGGWQAGDKRGGPFLQLAGKGYVLASVNYRLSQQAVFPAQIHDCKAAIRFLRANAGKYNVDPDRIGVWGSSAGGHLVALLGTSGDVKELEGDVGPHVGVSSRIQAVVDWFGPTDLTLMGKQSGANSRIDHDSPNSPESRLLGGPVQEKKDLARQANPLTFVTKDDPPFLIMHGDADPLVPPDQSRMLHDALKAVGVDTTLHLQAGAGHSLPGPAMQAMVENFFERTLKPRK
jgi:acetyl esterase/lipase